MYSTSHRRRFTRLQIKLLFALNILFAVQEWARNTIDFRTRSTHAHTHTLASAWVISKSVLEFLMWLICKMHNVCALLARLSSFHCAIDKMNMSHSHAIERQRCVPKLIRLFHSCVSSRGTITSFYASHLRLNGWNKTAMHTHAHRTHSHNKRIQ